MPKETTHNQTLGKPKPVKFGPTFTRYYEKEENEWGNGITFNSSVNLQDQPREEESLQKSTKGTTNKQRRKRIRKNKQLRIAAVNVRGIKGKIKSLESMLNVVKIDIALIPETKLENQTKINIKGYKWITRNRKTIKVGGIGILASARIANSVTDDDSSDPGELTEIQWIKLECRPKNIAIGA